MSSPFDEKPPSPYGFRRATAQASTFDKKLYKIIFHQKM